MGFDTFLGNTKALATVREIVASRRVPGALLFAGPEGVGKKTLALMLAKALMCEQRKDDFCGQCARCRKADEMIAAAREDSARRREMKDPQRRTEGLVYFDLQLIEPLTRFILIEQIRQMRAVAYARPFEFPSRVFILDESQAIHWQAVDLLLKMLEEPPETTTIILVCPNVYELRPTIRSRCIRVQFGPVGEPILRELVSREKRIPKSAHALAARVAAGSVARAIAFDLEQFERRRRPWLDYLECLSSRAEHSKTAIDWRALLDSTRGLAAKGEDFEETLKMGYSLLRDLLLVTGGREDSIIHTDLRARLRPLAERLGLHAVEQIKDGLDQAYRLQTRNVNQQLGLESLAVEVLSSRRPLS